MACASVMGAYFSSESSCRLRSSVRPPSNPASAVASSHATSHGVAYSSIGLFLSRCDCLQS